MTEEQAPPQTRPLSSLVVNLKTGLRAAIFLPINPDENDVSWTQLALITSLGVALQFLGDFAQIGRHGELSLSGLPGTLFSLPIMVFAAWALARLANRSDKTLSLVILFSTVNLFVDVLSLSVNWLPNRIFIQYFLPNWQNGSYTVFTIWLAFACYVIAVRLLALSRSKTLPAVILTMLIIVIPLDHIYRDRTLWTTAYDQNEANAERKRRHFPQNEDIFYAQPKLLERELASVTPSRQDGPNLFFVGVAGFSDQDVFMKEIHYVNNLFSERFGTSGHSITLINNPKTAAESPIASATSLGLSLKRVGAMMDPGKDILFLYLTSHGSQDHKFSLEFGSMQFNDLDPTVLRKLLDESGIKRRVVVIAACYSGGFIDALKTDDTLVITSAAPDKTSFGCGNDEEFTYFGKAYFAEALQKTDSFIDAFELAKPVIEAREKSDGYPPSAPRIFVGSAIRGAVAEFSRQRLSIRTEKGITDFRQRLADNKPGDSSIAAAPPKVPAKDTTGDKRLGAAQNLVGLMQYKTMIEEGIRHCKELAKANSPEKIFQTSPNYFKGITPQSTLWPKVAEAYREYFDVSCNYIGPDDYETALAQAYSSSLTIEAMTDSIKFYSSPTGRKLVRANMAASFVLQEETTRHATATNEKAEAEYNRKIADLATIERQSKTADQVKNNPWWYPWYRY